MDRTSLTSTAVLVLAAAHLSLAAEAALPIQGGDTVKNVLERSEGQVVTLRLGSGEELRGKVAKVGNSVVQISELAGREFFDAVVPVEAIHAVIIKARSQ